MRTATRRPDAPLPFGVAEARASRFGSLSREFEAHGLGQAADVMRDVRAVPSILIQIDQVLGVGGWPTDRIGLVHGESNGGKTEFVLALILSFLMRDHAGLFVDAEHTTPKKWVRQLMGGYADHPGFRSMYPSTYEETVDAVEKWATAIGEAKEKGRLDPETTGLAVVDSLRKLTPKKLLEKMMKEDVNAEEDTSAGPRRKKPGGIDGLAGRAAQHKAALNAAWMDRLTPLLFQTGTGLVLIARETEAADRAGMTSFANFDDWKVGGGKAPYFESSVVARVTKAGEVYNELKQIVSERHDVQIRKTKIAGKLVRYPVANFYVSSGLLTPYGFDRARDLLELGEQLGSIIVSGSSYTINAADGTDTKIANGKDNAVRALTNDAKLFELADRETRLLFMPKDEGPVAPKPINRRNAPKPAKKKAAKKKGRGKR